MPLGTHLAVYFLGQGWGSSLWGAVGGGSRRARVEGSLVEAVSPFGATKPGMVHVVCRLGKDP